MEEAKKKEIEDLKKAQASLNPKLVQVIQMGTRMTMTKWNIVVFKDDPWLYIQYYLGIYLQVPTILIVRKSDKYFAKRLKNPYLKHLIIIDKYGDENSSLVADKIKEIVSKTKI